MTSDGYPLGADFHIEALARIMAMENPMTNETGWDILARELTGAPIPTPEQVAQRRRSR